MPRVAVWIGKSTNLTLSVSSCLFKNIIGVRFGPFFKPFLNIIELTPRVIVYAPYYKMMLGQSKPGTPKHDVYKTLLHKAFGEVGAELEEARNRHPFTKHDSSIQRQSSNPVCGSWSWGSLAGCINGMAVPLTKCSSFSSLSSCSGMQQV